MIDQADQHIGYAPAQAVGGEAHGRQRRIDQFGERYIVKPSQSDVAGNRQAGGADNLEGANGD